MHVVGIDLAASPATTGVVVLEPGDARWRARVAAGPADDDLLVGLAVGARSVGVDAPLGWPDAFVDAVGAHHASAPWPGGIDRTSMTHRETDRRVRGVTGRLPLSVSADLLGVVAMRCALLQRRWGDEVWGEAAPRDGRGRLRETYPAAAFAAWGIAHRGYKARRRPDEAISVRTTIVRELAGSTASWLDLQAVADEAVASDHVLDALVCALVSVAADAGDTAGPPVELTDVARREGWIHVPIRRLDDLDPRE